MDGIIRFVLMLGIGLITLVDIWEHNNKWNSKIMLEETLFSLALLYWLWE